MHRPGTVGSEVVERAGKNQRQQDGTQQLHISKPSITDSI
jgi:hypothetical protein